MTGRARRKRRNETPSAARRGATTVEMAFVLMAFLLLVLGMLDFGLAVYRYNTLAQTARQVARQAIVHGSLANRLGTWGPGTYSGDAEEDHPIADTARPSLIGFDLSEVAIRTEWIDGDNDPDSLVRVTAEAPFTPMLTFLFGSPTYTLRSTSTMQIAH